MIEEALAASLEKILNGKPEDAVAPLTELTASHPGHLGAQYALAHALEMLERWPEARQAWLTAARWVASAARVDVDEFIDEVVDAMESPRATSDEPAPLEAGDEEVVTETWASILASQAQYQEAERIYLLLAKRQPHREAYFREQATSMRSLPSTDAA